MADLFKDYGIVLLDISCVAITMSDELKESLKASEVCLQNNTADVAKGIVDCLNAATRKKFIENWNFLRTLKVKYPRDSQYGQDVWTMIKNRKLIWPDKKIVVVTSRLLIGKLVITSGIDVDVYNVLDKKIYNAALYPNVKANNIKKPDNCFARPFNAGCLSGKCKGIQKRRH